MLGNKRNIMTRLENIKKFVDYHFGYNYPCFDLTYDVNKINDDSIEVIVYVNDHQQRNSFPFFIIKFDDKNFYIKNEENEWKNIQIDFENTIFKILFFQLFRGY